jgi:hypothetical protein
MTSTNRTTIPTRVSQCLAAAALMVAVTIGAAAVASAEPREWDIGAYDQCRSAAIGKGLTPAEWYDAMYSCCIQSGGDWNAGTSQCQAPPAVQEVQPQPTRPVVVGPGGITTETLEPAPGVAPPTFAPAPANPG